VAAEPPWRLTPRQSIEAECARRGPAAVVDGCVRLIAGADDDPDLLVVLAGPAAHKFFDGRPHDDVYWFRVWGTRGLLWAWNPRASSAVERALADEHWRVREMALKVVARHRLDDAFPLVVRLRTDPVARVRVAAERAVAVLSTAGA
jgi:HEAT repeats